MKLAFTMWWNDLVVLDFWLSYYSKHFDHLHVMFCGRDVYIPKLEERATQYPLTYSRHTESMINVEDAAQAISDKQKEFLQDYDWVLFTNCDEIIAPDPKYKNFDELIADKNLDSIPCEGFDVLCETGVSIDYRKPVLKQCKYWVKDVSYNKTILSRVPIEWNSGQHAPKNILAELTKEYKDTGLYLIHLKWADNPGEDRDTGPFKSQGAPGFKDEDKVLTPDWVKELI